MHAKFYKINERTQNEDKNSLVLRWIYVLRDNFLKTNDKEKTEHIK